LVWHEVGSRYGAAGGSLNGGDAAPRWAHYAGTPPMHGDGMGADDSSELGAGHAPLAQILIKRHGINLAISAKSLQAEFAK
jgi:hypothetical protein